MRETLESSRAKDDAISAALEGIPDIGADWTPPGQAEIRHVDESDGDGHLESASTETSPQAKAADKSPVTRAVESPADPKIAPASTFEAPKNWGEDARKAFALSPADAQKAWLDMQKKSEAGFTRYSQEMAPIRKEYEQFKNELAPYAAEIQQAGMTPGQAFAFMAQERQAFNQQPDRFLVPVIQRLGPERGAALLKAVIEGAGIRQEQIFGSQPQQPQQEDSIWVDPRVLQLEQRFQNETSTLQQKLQQLEYANQLRQHQEQQARQQWEHAQRQQHEHQLNTIENDLVNLLGSADEAGNPKYPDFDDIQDELIELLETPRFKAMPVSPEKFDKAYRQVMRGRDDYFDKQVQAEASRRAAETQQQKAVQKAAAAATRKPGPGSQGQVRQGPMTANAAIAKAFEDLGIN